MRKNQSDESPADLCKKKKFFLYLIILFDGSLIRIILINGNKYVNFELE